MEGARSAAELGGTAALLPWLRRAPRGDGHPVLVLPGFTAGDGSTTVVRRFLRDRGYFVHGWRLGTNLGPTDRVLDGLDRRVRELVAQHGQPLSLVGWSLGGIYARELARADPAAVRQVITLGSPFRLRRRGASNATPLYRALGPTHSARVPAQRPPEEQRPPLTMPATAVYTKTDAVVPWSSCVEAPGEGRDSIEVRGSHSGLGHNAAVLWVVADRLAQPAGEWTPFRPTPMWQRMGGVSGA